jgi:hypothetical protein
LLDKPLDNHGGRKKNPASFFMQFIFASGLQEIMLPSGSKLSGKKSEIFRKAALGLAGQLL